MSYPQQTSPDTSYPPWKTQYDPHRHNGSIASTCSKSSVKPLNPKPEPKLSQAWQRMKSSSIKAYSKIDWTPTTCRWNPDNPPKFTLYLNLVFAWATAVSAANLYYTHPILDILATEFGVNDDRVAQIPTVIQAGYAIGLFTLCPLGDVFRRRQLVLRLCLAACILWIILCTTSNIAVFTGVSFICAFLTVTPQLMFPLVGDLAPPARRAAALSIITSGLMFGQLLARLTAGVIGANASWRIIFWLALGFQISSLVLLYLHMPDYPATNPTGLNYFQNIWSIVQFLYTKPILLQACLASYFTAATFSLFWTTLTFLLTGPRYNYTNTTVGLFAFVILVPIVAGPFFGRHVIDRFVPLISMILSQSLCLLGIVVGTATGRVGVAGPVVQAMLGDFGNQMSQTACRSNIYTLSAKARNRVNTALMTFVFAGQMTGTAVGSALYDRGGWVASGGYSIFSICVALAICFSRGPWEDGWVGWSGGWSIVKKNKDTADGKTVEQELHCSAEQAEAEKGDGRQDEEMGISRPPGQGVTRQLSAGMVRPQRSWRPSTPGAPRQSRWREGMDEVDLRERDDDERSENGSENDDLREEKDGETDDDGEEDVGEAGLGRQVSDGSRHTRFFSLRSSQRE